MTMPLPHKRLVIAAFDALEREAGRHRLSERTQFMVKRAREVVAEECAKQRKAWQETGQIPIQFPKRINTFKRKGRSRYSVYPFAMVEEARKMRANQHGYREISEALNTDYGTQVSWVTVRDWCQNFWRLTG